jgi:hypothetical protein
LEEKIDENGNIFIEKEEFKSRKMELQMRH